MKLSDLAGSEYTGGDVEIVGLTADSRAVKPGYLFAALKGVASDGRDYIPQALAAGAAAILSETGLGDQPVPVVEDDEPRRRLAQIAARFTPRQPDVVVAVTGTNGKSSTVDFLRQIWAAAGMNGASLGTLGVTTPTGYRPLHHTTPDPVAIHHTLDAIAGEGVSHVALEASSHGLAQHRLDAVHVSVVGFTNLTQDHLDYHPDFEDYFAAKMRLFRELAQPGAPAIINSDGEWGARVVALAREQGLDVRTFGWSGDQLIPYIEACIEARIELIEQPLPADQDGDLFDLECATIICADESVHGLDTLSQLTGKYQALNIKLDKTGGLTEALKVAESAEKMGLDIMVGCMLATSLGMAPAMVVAQIGRAHV